MSRKNKFYIFILLFISFILTYNSFEHFTLSFFILMCMILLFSVYPLFKILAQEEGTILQRLLLILVVVCVVFEGFIMIHEFIYFLFRDFFFINPYYFEFEYYGFIAGISIMLMVFLNFTTESTNYEQDKNYIVCNAKSVGKKLNAKTKMINSFDLGNIHDNYHVNYDNLFISKTDCNGSIKSVSMILNAVLIVVACCFLIAITLYLMEMLFSGRGFDFYVLGIFFAYTFLIASIIIAIQYGKGNELDIFKNI